MRMAFSLLLFISIYATVYGKLQLNFRKLQLSSEIENFYEDLCSQQTPPPTDPSVNKPRDKLTRHYTEELSDINLGEIRIDPRQL